MDNLVPTLPHVNAALNGLATLLLIVGYVLIRLRHEVAHKWTMLSCFGTSVLFLISYVTYHVMIKGVKNFPAYPSDAVRYTYYTLLISHIILAAAVPPLAIITIYLALRDRRATHRLIARWTFPIWLYVSITGVIVYLLLYHVYVSA